MREIRFPTILLLNKVFMERSLSKKDLMHGSRILKEASAVQLSEPLLNCGPRIVSHRVNAAREGYVHEDECIGGGVGGHPEEEVLGDLGHGELEGDGGEEDAVKDGEALQQVGKAWLKLHILLVQGPNADDVS